MAEKCLELKDIKKAFSKEEVLKEISLSIEKGEFITLLGSSGCGKTTTLRIIAGLETPDSGQVFLEGKDVTALPPETRDVNTVFQNYALFPHMTVADNIGYGLKLKKTPKAEIKKRVSEMLELVQLPGYEKRKPSELSGGQKQRVAIARSLINNPKVLLLDEPLGALDLQLRRTMQLELKKLQKKLGITFIYITHDQEEALTMSDKIIVMNKGYIQQMGTPEDIYNEPENAFVADFIGDSNIIDGIMLEDRLVEIIGTKFPCVDEGFGRNCPVDVVIRPEDVVLKGEGEGIIDGIVTSLIFKGVHYEMEVESNGYEWLVHSTNCYPVGSKVSISVIPFNIQIMHKPESEDEKAVVVDE